MAAEKDLPTTGENSADSPEAGSAHQETMDRFKAALEAKRAGKHGGGGGTQDRDALSGHAKDGAHGHKVFRRKSG